MGCTNAFAGGANDQDAASPPRTIGSGGARFIRGDNGDAAALAANGELGVPDGRLALLLRVLWLEDGATCELC